MNYPASPLTPFPPTFPRDLFTSFADVSPLRPSFFPQPGMYPQPCNFPCRASKAQKHHFLSPLFATLTDSLSRKSFPCHSYANTRDGGATPPPIFSAGSKYRRKSFRIRSYRKCACKSYRMRSYENTGGGYPRPNGDIAILLSVGGKR